MTKYRLIPYTVESVIEDIREIPEGVKMIKAPEIWDERSWSCCRFNRYWLSTRSS
jgi:hypothetical protein